MTFFEDSFLLARGWSPYVFVQIRADVATLDILFFCRSFRRCFLAVCECLRYVVGPLVSCKKNSRRNGWQEFADKKERKRKSKRKKKKERTIIKKINLLLL